MSKAKGILSVLRLNSSEGILTCVEPERGSKSEKSDVCSGHRTRQNSSEGILMCVVAQSASKSKAILTCVEAQNTAELFGVNSDVCRGPDRVKINANSDV